MRRTLGLLLVLALAGCSSGGTGTPQNNANRFVAGDGKTIVYPKADRKAAPVIDESTLDGGRFDLAAQRGHVVVVNFWASWCAPCKREAPQLEQSWKAYGGQGLVVLGIDANDVTGDAQHFARRHGLTYPLVHAPTTIWDDWGVTGVPETFFVDRHGRLVDVHVAGPVLDGGNKAQFERGIRLALRS